MVNGKIDIPVDNAVILILCCMVDYEPPVKHTNTKCMNSQKGSISYLVQPIEVIVIPGHHRPGAVSTEQRPTLNGVIPSAPGHIGKYHNPDSHASSFSWIIFREYVPHGVEREGECCHFRTVWDWGYA